MNPSAPIRVLLVGTIPSARPATCDPAIDLAATSPAALTRYERERSDEARADIVLLPAVAPSLFEVRALTPRTFAWVMEVTGEMRSQRAFLASCHAYTDAQGAEHRAPVEVVGKITLARDEWLDEVWGAYGAAAIREVAQVAIDRAEAGPAALAPFALPLGLMLPR
jgi:hypothetical protein